jgi:hypothetical protein
MEKMVTGAYELKTLNDEHSIAVQKKLFDLGYSWSGKTEAKPNRKYIYFRVGKNDFSLTFASYSQFSCTHNGENYIKATLDDLFNMGTKNVEIQLNKNYSAIIDGDYVHVGCQKIKCDVVIALADTIREINYYGK